MIETSHSSSRRRKDPDAVKALVERLFGGVFLVLAALIIWRLIVVPYPLFGDIPTAAYEALILKGMIRTGIDTNPHYLFTHYPPMGGLTVMLLALMSTVLDMAMAARVLVVGTFLVFVFACRRLAYGADRTGGAYRAMILLASFAAGRFFWGGTFDVMLAFVLFAHFVLGERSHEDTRPGRILIYSVLMFFTHPAMFGVFVGYIVARAFVEARFFRRTTALIPAIGLAAWHIAAHAGETVTAAPPYDPTVFGYSLYKLATFSLIGPYVDLALPWGGTLVGHGSIHWILIALNGLFVLAATLGILLQRRLPLGEKQVPVTGLFILIAGVSLFIPWRVGSVTDVGLLVLAMSAFYLLVHARMPAWTGMTASTVAAVFLIMQIVVSFSVWQWTTTAIAAPVRTPMQRLYTVDPFAEAPYWLFIERGSAGEPVTGDGFVRMR